MASSKANVTHEIMGGVKSGYVLRVRQVCPGADWARSLLKHERGGSYLILGSYLWTVLYWCFVAIDIQLTKEPAQPMLCASATRKATRGMGWSVGSFRRTVVPLVLTERGVYCNYKSIPHLNLVNFVVQFAYLLYNTLWN